MDGASRHCGRPASGILVLAPGKPVEVGVRIGERSPPSDVVELLADDTCRYLREE